MKICTKCKIEKQIEEFPKLKTSKDGHNTQCRKCKNLVHKAWVKKNPDKRKAALAKYDSKGYWERNREKELKRNKQWKKDNAELVAKSTKEWRKNNPDKVKATKKRYYEKHKEEHRERTAAYFRKYPEKKKEYQRKTREKESHKEWLKAWNKARAIHRTVKGKARKLVHHMVKSGSLIRPTTCSQCNKEGKVEGHHTDYSKPLEVVWLCSMCHTKEHKR